MLPPAPGDRYTDTVGLSGLGRDISRRLRSALDNTLFVYPTQFLGFSHRNLCVKVELVSNTKILHEFISNLLLRFCISAFLQLYIFEFYIFIYLFIYFV